jgi:CPA1 family monovalent cation:H+ antiporter
MSFFHITAILITLAALFSYANYRWLHFPTTIGVMVLALAASLALIGLGSLGTGIEGEAKNLLDAVNFDAAVLHGMLGFLLFAGALHIELNDLGAQKWTIGSLATVGVITSTVVVGGGTWAVLHWLHVETPILVCMLFGALISPTDPIAVLGILTTAGAPKRLEIKVAGESLFNDGVGVVVFLVILELVRATHHISAGAVGVLFAEEALGGAAFGLAIGWVAYYLLKSVDNYKVEVLLTLALVAGGYAVADQVHISGPIAMVVAGLLIGNQGRAFAMSERTRKNLDMFWELVDETLNAVLFLLLGLELLVLPVSGSFLVAGLLIIPIVLLARLVSVSGVMAVLRMGRGFTRGALRVLVWGGLRGGISVALALSIPDIAERPLILVITYAVVVFSIVVQGLTVGPLIKRIVPTEPVKEQVRTS